MIQDTLFRLVAQAVRSACPELGLAPEDAPDPELTRPRLKEHGDWSTNVALVLASRLGRPPRSVAEAVARHLPPTDLVERVEVAGPGFVNLFLSDRWLHEVLREVLERGEDYGRAPRSGRRAQVEFVSANPTGPLTMGHARNAALGDALANVLEAAGWTVEREYYLNDAGRQMELFGASVEAHYLRLFGRAAEVPEGGYHGPYLAELARAVAEEVGDSLLRAPPEERRARLRDEGMRLVLEGIRATLERFGVRFDTWFSERTLHESGAIREAVDRLRRAGFAYERDGAVFFRSTEFGDEKDRVLIRSTGEPTYFAADCAYLLHKFGRGFDRLVYVWGADHHGAVKRLKGAAQAFGFDPDAVDFVLYQLVSLYRGGQPVRMSKRTGELVSLDEVLDEVGPDATRYGLVSRSADSPLDFDIEEAKRQSLENPVYYVQYAHARISSLLRVAREQGVELKPWPEVDLGLLREEAELDLLRKLSELPEVVQTAAASLGPHRLTRYAEEVAAAFHRFYTDHRVISDDEPLTQARLWLAVGTRQVVATALRLIGVSAPESMERIGGGQA
ncbi:MAG TPA: arginine--tRNA ligase [Actinomycetota bacterium]|nr:arginine--tRNA ligase [Actinomycetota bacterium]